jgi:hypothetical protein
MHKLRRAAHVLTFTSALAALTGFVVADVIAAESEGSSAMALVESTEADPAVPAPVPLLAVVVPDAVVPEAIILEPPAPPRKKKGPRKIKFGRFDSY